MPQKVIHGEQTTLTCLIGGILPKSPKITWIKKMRGGLEIDYMAQSGADFSESEFLVSKLSFTPNIVEDEGAVFICRFSHETVNVTMHSGPAICKVFDARLSITTDPSPVTAQLGSDVVLKCDFTVDAPTPDLQYLIVKWFFNDTDLAEFNDKLIPSSSKVTMSEREIQNGNASLSIPKVTPADEGDYKCFVLYTPDKEEKTIRLKVEAPPRIQVSDPLIYKGRVNTLTCSASGYYPEDIRVMWLKDGQVLHNANLSTPQRNTHGTFNILCSYTFTPTMEDKDKTYSCHVNHTALRGPIQKDLQFVDARLAITTDPSPVRAPLGSDIVLKCDFTVDTPTPDLQYLIVRWFLNDKLLVEFNDKLIPSSSRVTMSERELQNGNASLSIPKVTPADEGDYKCFVLYTPDKEEKTIRLKVEAPPSIQVSDPQVEMGIENTLSCSASGYYPEDIRVMWLKDGQVLKDAKLSTPQRNTDGTFNISCSYTFTPTTQDKDKTYSCRVNHTALQGPIKKDLKLLFVAVPKVTVSEPLRNQDNVSVLTCEARGHYPKNITVEWRSGGQVQTDSFLVTRVNKDNTFNTINTYTFTSSDQDRGKAYSCHVSHISLKEPIQEDLILQLLDENSVVQERKSGLIRTLILAVLIPVVILVIFAVIAAIMWLIWRRRYTSEISFPRKYTLGQEAFITANLSYLFKQNVTAKWWLCGLGDSLVEITEREQPAPSESLPLITNEERVMSFTNEKAQNWPTKLLTSRLSYKPQVAEAGHVFICRFYRDGKEIPHTNQRTHNILIFARPEVSDIKEIPVSGEDEVKFTVDVSKFYPEEIQIHWSLNGKQLEGETSEPQCNVSDGTYSVTNQIVIPEGQLKGKNQIKVIIEHESMEKPAVKEKTLQDPATRRRYRISEISMPQKVIDGEQTTLSCAIGGMLPKSPKIAWIKKMRGDQPVKYMAQSEADFSSAELLVSKLTFTPNIAEDEEAEFICTFSHETAHVTLESGPAVCKVFGKPTVSAIEELPMTDKEVVNFALDVTEFYPRDIQIKWIQNGRPIPGQGEPQTNADGTYSMCQTVAIPEGNLKAGDKVGVSVEHISLESALTKEITAVDTATRRGYRISEISMPQNVTHGEQSTLTCAIGGILPKSQKITWIKKMKGDQQIKQMSESEADFSRAELLVSKLTFTPNIVEDEEAEFICRFSHESANVTMDSGPAVCKVFGKPTVSAVQELPVTDEEVVNFAVDVTEFYPQDIQIFWTQNGHPLTSQGEPQTNSDGTYSIRQTVAIPEGDLMAGDKVGVSVEHASLESALTKEITAVDTATRRGYRISKISMPQNVIHGEQTTLTCAIGGILPKSPKITWIKKMKGDQQIKQMSESEADFSSAELLVSKLTFTANIAEDEEAEFICRFSHESANVTMNSGPAVCKVFGKPTVSTMQELPVTDEEVVNFPNNNIVASSP
nr:PREDICTED: uncharacterized protein LOC102350557 [Latimeria chalumnae]|eukprot:XP_014347592.1 PREDICTED: uncharacterized protein LOC102350557 [Latimeria chalumnae]